MTPCNPCPVSSAIAVLIVIAAPKNLPNSISYKGTVDASLLLLPQSQFRKMWYWCVSDAHAGRCLEISITFIDRRLETGGHRWGGSDVPTMPPHRSLILNVCESTGDRTMPDIFIFRYNYSTDYRPGIHRTSTGDRWSSTDVPPAILCESGIGRLSAGHLSDIGRCQVNARSGLVARSEDGDEMTESRSSRRFCSTLFLTIFLIYIARCPSDIGPGSIVRLHIAHTYCCIVRTSETNCSNRAYLTHYNVTG
jgi:hypothetical protein